VIRDQVLLRNINVSINVSTGLSYGCEAATVGLGTARRGAINNGDCYSSSNSNGRSRTGNRSN
jgi:hypothetical protein